MSENAWQSDKKFLKTVADLSCLSPSKTDSINTFTNDAEILYTTLFSIFKFSSMKDRIRKEAYNELRKFAKSAQIATFRQRDLRRKVHLSNWNAKTMIAEKESTGTAEKGQQDIDSFMDDFVAVCLQDKKIELSEYKLIYLVGDCLGLQREQISKLLRPKLSKLQYRAILFFQRPYVSNLITFLIILNAIQLGLMTCSWFDQYKGKWFYQLDFAFICIFTVEIFCRIFAFRKDFFRSFQNIFDLIVVAISWIPSPIFHWASAMRIFRAMLLLNRFSQLKAVIKSLVDALPSIGWVSVLLFLVYYVFAVFTTSLFRTEFASFQSLGRSFFSLFQLMTLESWPELLTPILEKYPYAWLVFIPFMILTSYIFLNLVIGIIVTSMHEISLKQKSTEKREIDEIWELKEQIGKLSNQIASIRELLDKKNGKDE